MSYVPEEAKIRSRPTLRILAFAYLSLLAIGPTRAQEAGNPQAGAEVFKKCMACHRIGPNAKLGVGPVLNGIVNRLAGTYPGYNYTKANKESGLTWDVETLSRYLKAPKLVVPGTKMTFAGLSSAKDIADLIAYLGTFDAEGNTVTATTK